MKSEQFKSKGGQFLKKWWASIVLVPLIWYSVDQAYMTLRFNIFFSISYDFPFPVNIIHIFLDNFLLTVHEAGHTFFSIFGWRMLTILAGSLFQIIIPLLILAYAWFNRVKTGIQFSLYLVGFSFVDVAFYIADGGARQLPLLGNLSKEYHDWHNLLTQWNALEYDITIAVIICATGATCYLAALLLPAFFQAYRSVNIDMTF
ncbi:MAG: hypothetical protein JXR26_10870 [Balneolaceae bacterium]|nr:hypothetical protein [Balneolaceae bacterium]